MGVTVEARRAGPVVEGDVFGEGRSGLSKPVARDPDRLRMLRQRLAEHDGVHVRVVVFDGAIDEHGRGL